MLRLFRARSSLLLLLPLLYSTAAAQDMNVFGIPLGKEFIILECPREKYGYKINISNVCFERLSSIDERSGKRSKDKNNRDDTPTANILNEKVKVRFPIAEKPQVIKGDGFLGVIMDGKLEGIGFNTMGVTNDDSVLERLKEKYGEPSLIIPRMVQNKVGASFETFDATWNFPNLYVQFQGVVYWIDSGLVNIDTKKGKEYREQELRKLLRDKRPL